MEPPVLLTARTAPLPQLQELTVGMRRALLQRGEHLSAGWPAEAAEDLRSGRLEGVVLQLRGEAAALGILSRRSHRAFGQVHVATAPERVSTAQATIDALRGALGPEIERLDVGLTGLTNDEEEELGHRLQEIPGFEVIHRFGLRRAVGLDAPPDPPQVPAGWRFAPAREVALEPLNRLDWEAFRGSPDAAFIADTPEANRRLIEGIVAGQLGRFLEEASVAIVDAAGVPGGFILTVEESPRVGVIVDVAVDPAHRRLGLGRALMLRSLRALLALGHTAARLWVTDSNRPARALYESLGFEADATALIYRWRRSAPAPTAGPSPQTAR